MNVKVVKVSCKYFMNFSEIAVDLEEYNSAIITEYKPSSGKEALATAIQFLTDPKFIDETNAFKLKHAYTPPSTSGFVTLKLKIWNEEESNEPFYVHATRAFSTIGFIYVKKDGDASLEFIRDFQNRFKTHSIYVFPFINLNVENPWNQTNLFSFFEYKRMTYTLKALIKINDWINCDGYRLSETVNPDHFTTMIANLHYLNILERVYYAKELMSLANKVNEIFCVLTNQKFSVRFALKAAENLSNLMLKDMDSPPFEDMMILIRAGDDEIQWTDASDVIQLILKISVQIAVAAKFNISIIFLKSIDKVKLYQQMECVTSALLKESSGATDKMYSHINYIQNIVDLCNSLNIQAIIEYSGYVPVKGCNVVLCKGFEGFEHVEASYFNVQDIFKDFN